METSKKQEQKSIFFDDIQDIANQIRSDVEKQLKKTFRIWQVIEHQALPPESPEGSSHQMKILTDDKDRNTLKLSTSRANTNASWKTVIDEFFRSSTPFDHLFPPFDSSRTGFDTIQSLAESLKKDIEKDLNMTFDTFDVMESHQIMTDPEHTSYYMRIKTNDNGHVRINTIKKLPGSNWETHVEEFSRGKALESQGEKARSLEVRGQNQETKNKGMGEQGIKTGKGSGREQSVSINEEPEKASINQAPA